ncbi:trk system potassium uptake protein TrkA [Halarsenatibacter silvermanii]|uniref:Trk system potassium uptake protein TrkA n=2 Tax=Halarsenatibacter silvermanii TaxID=321763 RepID=A0A1G9Q4X2_9FIRM|nr:trk system potassium uptake protein TrkA [Halarsenatibacter silvermanii]
MGRYLINDLNRDEHDIILVEMDENKCQRLQDRFDIETVQGDGADADVLEKAGAEKADVVLAVTKDDQDNLVICQIAERTFGVDRTFTTVNTPGNEKLFDWLGVNVAVSSASILSALVDQEVKVKDMKELLYHDLDGLNLFRLTVAENSPVEGKKLKEIDMPQEVVFASVLRGDSPLVPRGNTRLFKDDLIICLARNEVKEDVENLFNPE